MKLKKLKKIRAIQNLNYYTRIHFKTSDNKDAHFTYFLSSGQGCANFYALTIKILNTEFTVAEFSNKELALYFNYLK